MTSQPQNANFKMLMHDCMSTIHAKQRLATATFLEVVSTFGPEISCRHALSNICTL